MRTKVLLTGLALLALTMVGNAQNKKGPGTGVCDGTGPKTEISLKGVVIQAFNAVMGIEISVPTNSGDGVCNQDCTCNQDPIKDQDQLQDQDQIKAKDGTCVNK